MIFPARVVASGLALMLLAAGCGSPGSTVSTPSTPHQVAVSKTAVSASDPTIVYDANPPTRFAFDTLPADATALTPSFCAKKFGLACYTPAYMRAGYDVPSSATGAGQTIAIVDAYGSPTIQQDCATFSRAFALPACDLEIAYPGGAPTFNPQQHHGEAGWAFETSLDVEYAHALAPLAKIVLVVAANNGGDVLNLAEKYVVDNHLASVMSMSFGAPEAAIKGLGNNLQLEQAHSVYAAAATAGITVIASAGDNGASNGASFANALFPSSDPGVMAVGGTDLFLSDAGAYQSEFVWNDSISAQCPFGCRYGPIGAGGGAPSAIFPAPSYQRALSGSSARTTADVAYNAGVYTAVFVYLSFPSVKPGYYFVGGTSAGAPQWAGIIADANAATGRRLGFVNSALYAIAGDAVAYPKAFHDITSGSNAFFGPGFTAGSGYDIPTGIGTPDVANLISALASH